MAAELLERVAFLFVKAHRAMPPCSVGAEHVDGRQARLSQGVHEVIQHVGGSLMSTAIQANGPLVQDRAEEPPHRMTDASFRVFHLVAEVGRAVEPRHFLSSSLGPRVHAAAERGHCTPQGVQLLVEHPRLRFMEVGNTAGAAGRLLRLQREKLGRHGGVSRRADACRGAARRPGIRRGARRWLARRSSLGGVAPLSSFPRSALGVFQRLPHQGRRSGDSLRHRFLDGFRSVLDGVQPSGGIEGRPAFQHLTAGEGELDEPLLPNLLIDERTAAPAKIRGDRLAPRILRHSGSSGRQALRLRRRRRWDGRVVRPQVWVRQHQGLSDCCDGRGTQRPPALVRRDAFESEKQPLFCGQSFQVRLRCGAVGGEHGVRRQSLGAVERRQLRSANAGSNLLRISNQPSEQGSRAEQHGTIVVRLFPQVRRHAEVASDRLGRVLPAVDRTDRGSGGRAGRGSVAVPEVVKRSVDARKLPRASREPFRPRPGGQGRRGAGPLRSALRGAAGHHGELAEVLEVVACRVLQAEHGVVQDTATPAPARETYRVKAKQATGRRVPAATKALGHGLPSKDGSRNRLADALQQRKLLRS
mmetsp:Transcript_4138/g.16019  ORF Transcript_4138/g.16019 Transcript_4138/m.16019 type:complete len:586 (+) Transcript_4138:995-2752(+)